MRRALRCGCSSLVQRACLSCRRSEVETLLYSSEVAFSLSGLCASKHELESSEILTSWLLLHSTPDSPFHHSYELLGLGLLFTLWNPVCVYNDSLITKEPPGAAGLDFVCLFCLLTLLLTHLQKLVNETFQKLWFTPTPSHDKQAMTRKILNITDVVSLHLFWDTQRTVYGITLQYSIHLSVFICFYRLSYDSRYLCCRAL